MAGVGEGAQRLTTPHPTPRRATDTMDFSGLSLIKLKKQEMETQVCVRCWPSCLQLLPEG